MNGVRATTAANITRSVAASRALGAIALAGCDVRTNDDDDASLYDVRTDRYVLQADLPLQP